MVTKSSLQKFGFRTIVCIDGFQLKNRMIFKLFESIGRQGKSCIIITLGIGRQGITAVKNREKGISKPDRCIIIENGYYNITILCNMHGLQIN